MFKKRAVKAKGDARGSKRRIDDSLDEEPAQIVQKKGPEDIPPSTEEPVSPIATKSVSKGGFRATKKIKTGPSAPATDKEFSRDEIKEEINAVGPSKAVAANVRVTTLTDFQPDVCKDFLQTGYCGYGDTCKFLHIRDELRQKKPIDKEWETVAVKSSKSETSETLPYRCVLCKKDYNFPVRTNCGHIFCQKCFMARFKRKKECAICGKDTFGACQPIRALELDELIGK